MLTQFEKAALKQFGDAYAEKVVHAIRYKKIDRYTQHKGHFSAVVNATGRLEDSVNARVGDDEVGVYALAYINKLIYGEKPGTNPPYKPFREWKWVKDVGGTVDQLRAAYFGHGSSIWQRWKGQNSGLLDFDYSAEYSQLTAAIMKGFGELVVLDLKELENDFR